jgi:hypothetical protein
MQLSSVSFRQAVGYYAGMFVAPGNAGSIYSSRDGVSWYSRTNLSTQHTLNAVIGSDSTFVAVGYSAVVIQSAALVKLDAMSGTNPQFSLSGLTNRSYEIQKCDALGGSNWQPVASVTLSNAPVIWSDNSPANPNAFYRALVLP